MGLDMYLNKAKKVPGVTANDIQILDNYFDWLNRFGEYQNLTLMDWCSIEESDVRKDIIDMYENEFVQQYCYWDKNHEYRGWNSLWKCIAYWRKANAIHEWFVKNVQNGVDDCGIYEVSKEQLENLLTTVRNVLADRSKANVLLPTKSGFFFGNTDYDDWYFEDLKNTEEMLEEVLAETKFDEELVVYHSSW